MPDENLKTVATNIDCSSDAKTFVFNMSTLMFLWLGNTPIEKNIK